MFHRIGDGSRNGSRDGNDSLRLGFLSGPVVINPTNLVYLGLVFDDERARLAQEGDVGVTFKQDYFAGIVL